MSSDEQNKISLYDLSNQQILAQKILKPDDHPASLEPTSYQCKKCNKWTTIDHLSETKTVYFCGWCGSSIMLNKKLFTEEQLKEAVELCYDILTSFYEKKAATILHRRTVEDYVNS